MLYKALFLGGFLVSYTVFSQEAFNTTHLIAYYPFDDNTMDYSGKNNHAYPIGDIEFKEDRLGVNKKSLELKGNPTHLNVPNSRSLASVTNEFTLSSWVYVNDWGDNGSALLSKSSALNERPFYALYFGAENGSEIDFIIHGKRHRVKDMVLKQQQWFHIAIVVKDDAAKFYINGALIRQTKIRKSKFNKNQPLEIGRGRKGALNYWDGRLDELYIFSRALDENEIKTLMDNSLQNLQKVPESFIPMHKEYTVLNGNHNSTPAIIVSGNISYADKTANPNAEIALGPPDDGGKVNSGMTSYSIGCLGELVLEFTDYPLVDVPGPDLFVFEAGPVKEPTKLSISKDGINWVTYGTIDGGTAMIDLVDLIGAGEKFYFVKFKDVATQCNGPRAGADIDAVGVIVPKRFENAASYNISEDSKKEMETETQRLKEDGPINTDEKEIVLIDEKEIKLFTKTVKIKVWDSYEEDGDLINLYLNGKLLFTDLKVSKKGEFFEIELQSGENTIQVEALNEGTVSPNTSAITVFVKNQEYEIILSAKKGARDTLKIILD